MTPGLHDGLGKGMPAGGPCRAAVVQAGEAAGQGQQRQVGCQGGGRGAAVLVGHHPQLLALALQAVKQALGARRVGPQGREQRRRVLGARQARQQHRAKRLPQQGGVAPAQPPDAPPRRRLAQAHRGADLAFGRGEAQQMLGRAGRAGHEPEGFGYLLAASGPFLFGALHDLSGGWSASLSALLVGTAAMLVTGLWAAQR